MAISQQTAELAEPPSPTHHCSTRSRQHRAGHPGQARGRSSSRCSASSSEGHLLIEDVPGVGKTSLAKALAASIDCTFGRRAVHARPAARPTSSASRVWNRGTSDVRVPARARCSPTSCSADEINRASPKTQSALLEAMEERQVTVDGTTYPLAAAVHGDRHAEPDRARGHLPAAREPARPLPHAGRRSATRTAQAELEILDTHGDHDALDDIGAGGHRRRRAGA